MKKAAVLAVIILLFVSAVWVPKGYADVYFTENFEDWNENNWEEYGTIYPNATEAAYTGTYGLRSNVSTGWHDIEFDEMHPIPDFPGGNIFRYKCAIKLNAISGFSSGYMDVVLLRDSTITDCVFLQVNPEAGPSYYWCITTQWEAYNLTAIEIVQEQWYEFECVFKCAVDGYCYAWMRTLPDGEWQEILHVDMDTSTENPIVYANVGKPDMSSATTFDVMFDDITFSDTPGRAPEPEPTPPAPPAEGASNLQYYFRGDTYETLGVSAYGLDSDYTNSYVTVNVTYPVYYGFRVWLVSSANVSTELTSGEPEALMYLNGSETYDSYASAWDCPETSVNLGYQALKIMVYASSDGEEWTALASYISPVLITSQIEASTWTFTLQVAFEGANAVYSWGDSGHRSGVSGVVFTEPLESEVQLWRLSSGDYVGFILSSYISVIGEAFYVICLIGAAGVLYFRYRHFGIITFFFAIFGGVGGIVWFLVPPWAAAVTSALIILGTSFIVWKVIR